VRSVQSAPVVAPRRLRERERGRGRVVPPRVGGVRRTWRPTSRKKKNMTSSRPPTPASCATLSARSPRCGKVFMHKWKMRCVRAAAYVCAHVRRNKPTVTAFGFVTQVASCAVLTGLVWGVSTSRHRPSLLSKNASMLPSPWLSLNAYLMCSRHLWQSGAQVPWRTQSKTWVLR